MPKLDSSFNASTDSFVVVAPSGGDYTDLQSAINALSGGGKILVKKGTYTLTSAVTFSNSNITVEGEGDETVFNYNGGTVTTAFKMADTTQRTGFLFRNFKINATASGGVGFDLSKFAISTWENISIVGGSCFLANVVGTHYNRFFNCRVAPSGSGAYGFKFANTSHDNQVYNCRAVLGAGLTGYIVDSQNITLFAPNAETDAAIGIDIQANGHGCTIISPYLEGNAINLQIAANVEAPTIVGGQIIDGDTNNINNLGGRNITILNTWLGNGSYEPFTYIESQKDMPQTRWVTPLQWGAGISAERTPTTGQVELLEFEMPTAGFVDGVQFLVGTATSGNVRVGIYGPITTEETAADATLLVESASTAVGSINTPQLVSLTKTRLNAGRYYVGIQFDNTTARYGGLVSTTLVNGYTASYARGGGYGAFTTPCPSTSASLAIPNLRIRLATLTTI